MCTGVSAVRGEEVEELPPGPLFIVLHFIMTPQAGGLRAAVLSGAALEQSSRQGAPHPLLPQPSWGQGCRGSPEASS